MPSPRLQNYLRTQRKRCNLTQAEVAALLGCRSAAKVSRYERLARLPSLTAALIFEVIFGVPVRELFAGLYERVRVQTRERQRRLAQGWFAEKAEKSAAAPEHKPGPRPHGLAG